MRFASLLGIAVVALAVCFAPAAEAKRVALVIGNSAYVNVNALPNPINDAGSIAEVFGQLMHVVPPQSAPDWIKNSPLADPANPAGYVEIDKHTMQHVRFPEIFALGDAGSSPNSKTGAAIRKQAPVVVANLKATLEGRECGSGGDL